MGFNYVSEVSTPDSKAASEDAVISVANIFTFVKNREGSYEANRAFCLTGILHLNEFFLANCNK